MEIETNCLVLQAQQGKTAAFDTLVRRYQDRAVGYARSILHDPAAAEDTAQEAFVQAWRDIGQLREPKAFPVWLRRILFKHCDRVRRSQRLTLVSFDHAFHITGGAQPAVLAESAQDAGQVRRALHALPEREREAALLYYLGERDIGEIAAFLKVPRTTVKNRLHAARKRLRKELWEMAEEILEKEKPSKDEAFVENVLARILAEFNRQMRVDPHTADRGLLKEGREALGLLLTQPEPLEWEAMLAGFHLLYNLHELKAIAALMMRCLTQPLDDSQTAWVYYHLSNTAAWSGDAAGGVLAYEAFERWLPGKHPRIARYWPHGPVPVGASEPYYDDIRDIRLFSLGKSAEFAIAWTAVWRTDEYLARADAALADAEVKSRNQWPRFACLRMATRVCESTGKFERSRTYIEKMYAIAQEPAGEDAPQSWLGRALGHEINLCRVQQDEEGATRKKNELLELLAGSGDAPWARGERHDLGCQNIWSGQHDQALPLFEQNAVTGGQVNPWGYFMHAVAVWQVKGDRERTLSLLREMVVREEQEMTETFRNQPEFGEVKDDEEFLNAVRKPE